MTRHVLLLATRYGSAAGAAGLRAEGIATALRDNGWEVAVICAHGGEPEPVENGISVRKVSWLDLERLARSRGMHKTAAGRPRVESGRRSQSLLRTVAEAANIPDLFMTWIPGTIMAARPELRPGSVLISTGPVSSHVVARLVAGDRMWLADLNDLWARNPHRSPGAIRARIDASLESWCFKRATCLTTVNEPMREELQRRTGKQVVTVYNGFRPDDFVEMPASLLPGPKRLVFGGTLYPQLELAPLFQALAKGASDGWASPATLSIQFMGEGTQRAMVEADAFGVLEFCSASAPLAHDDFLKALGTADALILPLYPNDPYSLPRRFFDYVAVGRPILALGPLDRVGARLVVEHELGVALSSAHEVSEFLRDLVEGRTELSPPAADARRQFTWARSAMVLTETVESLR